MTDDWTEHTGGPCPAGLEDLWVAVRIRNADEKHPRRGKNWRWEHGHTVGDIVAYRVAAGPVVHVGETEEVG